MGRRGGILRHGLNHGKMFGDFDPGATPVGDFDAQIAAHALTEKLILVTHNTRHFEGIAGLVVEDWMGS